MTLLRSCSSLTMLHNLSFCTPSSCSRDFTYNSSTAMHSIAAVSSSSINIEFASVWVKNLWHSAVQNRQRRRHLTALRKGAPLAAFSASPSLTPWKTEDPIKATPQAVNDVQSPAQSARCKLAYNNSRADSFSWFDGSRSSTVFNF